MNKWNYGNEAIEIPVQTGETWMVGDDKFVCGDINHLDIDFDYDVIYCDPPWTQALHSGFYTKAGLKGQGGVIHQTIGRIAELSKRAKLGMFLEGSIKDTAVLDAAKAIIGEPRHTWQTTYYSKLPAVLYYFGESNLAKDFSGMDDEHTPAEALGLFNGVRVFDPCTGRGLTSRSAYQTGNKFVGTELNPRRLAIAIKRHYELIGTEDAKPVRV